MNAIQIVLAVVFMAGWATVMGLAFALANKRWHFATLPPAKRALVYTGFALVALALAAVGIVIWVFLAVTFFCTPPGCF